MVIDYNSLPVGVGKSAKPDGISKVQTATEVEIAAQLAKYLRGNPQGHNFSRVIGIGHSYGRYDISAPAVPSLHLY